MENQALIQFKNYEELKKLIDIEVSKAINAYYNKTSYMPVQEYNLSPSYNLNNRVEISTPNGFKMIAPSNTFIQAIGLIGVLGIIGGIIIKKI